MEHRIDLRREGRNQVEVSAPFHQLMLENGEQEYADPLHSKLSEGHIRVAIYSQMVGVLQPIKE